MAAAAAGRPRPPPWRRPAALLLLHLALVACAVAPAAQPIAALGERWRAPGDVAAGDDSRCYDYREDCAALGPALFDPSGRCKYPAAEQCMRTCGQCWRAHAAARCQSPPSICSPFCTPRVDWGAFLERATAHPDYPGSRLLSRKGPAIAEFPHFLSDAEADALVGLADTLGYRDEDGLPTTTRDVGKINCETPACLFNPLVGEVYRRVSDLIGLPMHNFESLEILRYKPGQHYKAHHDGTPPGVVDFRQVGAGPRILTVYFYLSAPEEGGETNFPKAGLKVTPEKGKVVIWANVKNDIWTQTIKATHEAVPVKRGVKVGATLCVHPFDCRAPERYASETC